MNVQPVRNNSLFRQRLWLVAEIALVQQCVLAGELICIWGMVANKDVACFIIRQLLFPKSREHSTMSHHCMIQGHCGVWDVAWRSSTGITTNGRRRCGCRHQQTVVSTAWKLRGHYRHHTGMPVNPRDRPGSIDWNVPPICKLPDCHKEHCCGCLRNISYRRDRLESRNAEDLLHADDISR